MWVVRLFLRTDMLAAARFVRAGSNGTQSLLKKKNSPGPDASTWLDW
jgi:hypothetical protein